MSKSPHVLGFNVTIPYKEKIIKYLSKLDTAVERSVACNVVKFEGSNLLGYNTDIFGIQKTFEEENIVIKNKKCVVFGTGGAARSAVVTLQNGKAQSVTTVARDQCNSSDFQADIYINATSSQNPYTGSFSQNSFVFDM